MSADNFDIDLGNPAVAGVFFIPERDGDVLDALDERARSSDALVLRANLSGCRDKGDLLRRLVDTFDLPGYFGHNWDALSDSLADLEWLEADGYVLLLDHAGDLREAAEADFETFIEILDDTAETWRERDIAFFSFVALRSTSSSAA
ncbi:MAG: barstar family protein [Rhodanobacteraceae bacterium]